MKLGLCDHPIEGSHALGLAHPPPDGRFQTIADIAGFWRELARSLMTQSGQS